MASYYEECLLCISTYPLKTMIIKTVLDRVVEDMSFLLSKRPRLSSPPTFEIHSCCIEI
jgi:hypothetical protein